jgi:hypothetical protein
LRPRWRCDLFIYTSGLRQISFKIKKAVPLNVSLRVECSMKSVQSVRCWVGGAIKDASNSVTYATCEAQLVDLQQLWAG